MIRAKIDIIAKLKEKGYTYYSIQQNKLIGNSVLTRIKNENIQTLKLESINTLCYLLECNIDDLIEFAPDFEEEKIIKKN